MLSFWRSSLFTFAFLQLILLHSTSQVYGSSADQDESESSNETVLETHLEEPPNYNEFPGLMNMAPANFEVIHMNEVVKEEFFKYDDAALRLRQVSLKFLFCARQLTDTHPLPQIDIQHTLARNWRQSRSNTGADTDSRHRTTTGSWSPLSNFDLVKRKNFPRTDQQLAQ